MDSWNKILLVGDTHGNTTWFEGVACAIAKQRAVDLIIQVGDFGWWPSTDIGPPIALAAMAMYNASGIPTWFLDGNHEHFTDLNYSLDRVRKERELGPTDAVDLLPGVRYLPRGHRFELDGCSFAVLGGAHSVDRRLRTQGRNWFPEERVTGTDLVHLGSEPCDVLLCHDAPAGYPIPGLRPDHLVEASWKPELPACRSHRALLRIAMRSVTPRMVIHGHYHVRYQHLLTETWDDNRRATVRIEGLAGESSRGSVGLLETRAGALHFEIRNP